MSRFERATKVADAVLREGYVLYPYRASSAKNRFRWAFGALAPRRWSEAGGCEPWWLESQCLVEPRGALRIEGRLRFLQIERRQVERASGSGFQPVDSLEIGGNLWLTFEEGEVREIDFAIEAEEGGEPSHEVLPFELLPESSSELIAGPDGTRAGRLLRAREQVRGAVHAWLEPLPSARPLMRLKVRVENDTDWVAPGVSRDEALAGGCVSTHLLLWAREGGFLSLIDPPAWARREAAACKNVGTWPVLAGAPGTDELVLSAPIILYDHPQIAPESPGDTFDATEIDELLALRTVTLTPQEKREARATDPWAAALVDRVERLPSRDIERMHGAWRDQLAQEMVPRAADRAAPEPIAAGARVRLRPGRRRTDAQDSLYAGMEATVQEVRSDVDGRTFVAVTIDADPAAELNAWCRRYHLYELDEVEPISGAPAAPP